MIRDKQKLYTLETFSIRIDNKRQLSLEQWEISVTESSSWVCSALYHLLIAP